MSFAICQTRKCFFVYYIVSLDLEYFCHFSRATINVTLNISSSTNIAASLEQCADAGLPYLFVQNATILGCGTLFWMENGNIPSNYTLNITSALHISANGTIIPLTDGRIPTSVQLSEGLALTISQANGSSNATMASSTDGTLSFTPQPNVVVSETISPLNTTALMSSNVFRSNGTYSVGASNGTQILSVNSSLSKSLPNATLSINATIQPSGVMVNVSSSSLTSTGMVHVATTFLHLNSSGVRTNVSNVTNSLYKTPLSSSAMVSRINSTRSHDIELSKTSSVGPNVNSISATKCRNSSMQNVTELVKAYKTEYFRLISIAMFTNVNYTLRVPNADNLATNCSFILGDKAPVFYVETKTSMVSFSHRYFSPGRYNARVSCTRNETVLVDAYRRILVDLPAVLNGLSCPNLAQTDTFYHCVFNVKQASALNVTVAIGNKQERHALAGKTSK